MHKQNSIKQNIICKIPKFSYDNDIILRNVDIAFPNNTITGLIGDNGMGKSTFINLMCNVIQRPKDTIIEHNFNRTMCTFQTPAILNRTVWNNVKHTVKSLGIDNIDEKIMRALKKVDLYDMKEKSANLLSGGQKMRLQIARLIASDADLWLLDEPFSGLDNKSSEKLINILISAKNNGNKIILSSHNVEIMKNICDDICLFEDKTITKIIPANEYFMK